MAVIPNNAIIKYNDYRKFVNFLQNQYTQPIENINPYEFFRVSMCKFKPAIRTTDFASTMFCGRAVDIPNFNIESDSFNRFTRFEDFTSRDEVRNLSLWALSCLKNLSYDKPVVLGKELEIIQGDNPRDGRLDVVALCQMQLTIFEVKIGLTSLLREGRYRYQIPAYHEESQALIRQYNKEHSQNIDVNIILLVGGDEGDIYPPLHPDCTSGQVGNISKIFYDSIEEYGIKFISANALWSVTAYSEIFNKKIPWDNLVSKIFSQSENVGLLSGGIVSMRNHTPELTPFDLLAYT